jgi:DNA polymerase I-like protein with 3'-5' exonuclease and polymerase domains
MAHLLDEHRVNGLKPLAGTVLGMPTDEDVEKDAARERIKSTLNRGRPVSDRLKKEDITYKMVFDFEPEVMIKYALKDAELTLLLFETLKPKLLEWPELKAKYLEDLHVSRELLTTEAHGMRVDRDKAQAHYMRLGTELLKVESECRKLTGLEDFNPGSSDQIKAFMESQGIVLKDTKKETLVEVEHPLCQLILAHRKADKLRSTYFSAMLAESEREGILHPSFRVNVRTGRMASGKEKNK